MDLSVIIVCYRGWEWLTRCLDALNNFHNESFTMEVIVADNNSGDGVIDEFEKRYSRFRFIKNNFNGGYGYGCNCAFAEAKGDFIMILNPDTVAGEKEISLLIERAKAHPEYSLLSCRQLREDGSVSTGAGKFPGLSLKNLIPFKPEETTSFPDWVSGSLMLIRKEVFSQLNGFDESFWMYYEDVDICKRIRDKGGIIALLNDISIIHNHGGSTRVNMKTTALTKCEVQISRHVYINKHFTGIEKCGMHLIAIADNMISGIIAGFSGLLFFFVPKLFVRLRIFLYLIRYYSGALQRKSWLSPRSVLLKKSLIKTFGTI